MGKENVKRSNSERSNNNSSRKVIYVAIGAAFLVAIVVSLPLILTKNNNDSNNNNDGNERHDDVMKENENRNSTIIITTNAPTLSEYLEPSSGPTNKLTSTPGMTPYSDDVPTTKPTVTNNNDYSSSPSTPPKIPVVVTYVPGNLVAQKVGLLLSEGLDAREIATSGERVRYDARTSTRNDNDFHGFSTTATTTTQEYSVDEYHGRPDGAATFPDPRLDNIGGWIYVSNSEMESQGEGGVGAITFDKDGNIIHYQRLLDGTTMNCSGGRTPWNTWVSCEEVEFTGQIYQVDPIGERLPEKITMGLAGGRWESFAYDVRDHSMPKFFATEDHNKGTVRRFIPDKVDWDEPWNMLTGPGTVDYLMIFPNSTNNGGTFIWTTNFKEAKSNAKLYYPQTEGIDVYKNEMVFVCKRIYQLFTLDLDLGTYFNHSTISGLFDGKPDQMQRILGADRDLLYFTEEGGRDAGIHARDYGGRYYSILESPVYKDETTGLAFSPNGMHMYVAYQENGKVFDIWRTDGQPFYYERLDVKYHQDGKGR